MSEKVRVLITGASGFVGGHLIQALEEGGPQEYEIFGTTFPEPPHRSRHNLLRLDICCESDVDKLLKDIRPGWIFHLAALSNVNLSWQRRRVTIETNVLGTHNLLEAIRNISPKPRLLFVSSSDVYGNGDGEDKLITEDAPVRVVDPYAYSKAAGELLCRFYAEKENTHIVVARPFPHTGPGQGPEFVCSDWARQIALIERGEIAPILNVGNLEVKRDYCDVRDVVNAYLLLMRKALGNRIYNICSSRSVSLHEILDFLIACSVKRNHISINAEEARIRKTDAAFLVGSNQRIRNEIGWTPVIPLSQTLKDLLEYWRLRPPVHE